MKTKFTLDFTKKGVRMGEKRLQLRIKDEVHDEFKQNTEGEGMTMSGYLRKCIKEFNLKINKKEKKK